MVSSYFQYRVVLPVWIVVGQGPAMLAVVAGVGCFDIFFSRQSFLFSIHGRTVSRTATMDTFR